MFFLCVLSNQICYYAVAHLSGYISVFISLPIYLYIYLLSSLTSCCARKSSPQVLSVSSAQSSGSKEVPSHTKPLPLLVVTNSQTACECDGCVAGRWPGAGRVGVFCLHSRHVVSGVMGTLKCQHGKAC